MNAFILDSGAIDWVLALVAVESVALVAWRVATGRGPAPVALIFNLLAGAFLLVGASRRARGGLRRSDRQRSCRRARGSRRGSCGALERPARRGRSARRAHARHHRLQGPEAAQSRPRHARAKASPPMFEKSDSLPLAPIDFPEDLRRLPKARLEEVADDVRREMIAAVSVTGGHLGAGLGVVELTVALHYVFDTPRDRLIWDVGHQAYPHKILTGRRDRIRTLRQAGGLSGFTKRTESRLRSVRRRPFLDLDFRGSGDGRRARSRRQAA